MTERFILDYIPIRIKQLAYKNYHIRYRDLGILAESKVLIPAFNELWFVVDEPAGISIESDYGLYDSTGEYIFENTHQHRGEITLSNPGNTNRRIRFIQVIIVN